LDGTDFEIICETEFQYLGGIGYHKIGSSFGDFNLWKVRFGARTTSIDVEYSIRDREFDVCLIPTCALTGHSDDFNSRFLRIRLKDLAAVGGAAVQPAYAKLQGLSFDLDSAEVVSIVHGLARDLLLYGRDLLMGDFSVYSKVQAQFTHRW
jgi:hypothetical protein